MSDLVKIEGIRREGTGKGYARKLRRRGLVPAVLMVNADSTILLELVPKWLPKAYKSGKRFLLELDGEEREVSIKDIQIDAVKRSVVHLDLVYA